MIFDVLKIRGIEVSSIYQDIYAKGHAKGYAAGYAQGVDEARAEAEGRAEGRSGVARKILLGPGRKKLGPPD